MSASFSICLPSSGNLINENETILFSKYEISSSLALILTCIIKTGA